MVDSAKKLPATKCDSSLLRAGAIPLGCKKEYMGGEVGPEFLAK